jgi:hypothetical protein
LVLEDDGPDPGADENEHDGGLALAGHMRRW